MKKAVLFLILFTFVFVAGCDDEALTSSNGNGMVDSRQQRRRRIALIMDMNDRSIQDDIDETWFFDNNLKLTPWEVSVGD